MKNYIMMLITLAMLITVMGAVSCATGMNECSKDGGFGLGILIVLEFFGLLCVNEMVRS